MAIISRSSTLAARVPMTAADLDQMFADIVGKVGGTYYASNAPVVASGSLDRSNFRERAGITNEQKASPYSLVACQMSAKQLSSTASVWALDCQLHGSLAPHVEATLFALTFTYAALSAGGSTGMSANWNLYKEGTTETTIASGSFSNIAGLKLIINQDLSSLNISVYSTEMLRLVFDSVTWPGGTSHSLNAVGTVWLKHKHVA